MSLRFAVYGLPDKDYLEKIASLRELDMVEEIYYEEKIAEKIGCEGCSIEKFNEEDLDFVMCVGGDGTILRLMQFVDKPVLGVNTGTLGFLTTIEISKVEYALNKIEQNDYFVDRRMKLDIFLNGEKCGECLNEVVIHSDKVAKLREIKIIQGQTEVDHFRGDGIIISTPTGSTSYSLSSGGPIVDPQLDVFLSVPIASFDLDAKPYVLPSERSIKVDMKNEDKACLMVLDGQGEFKVESTDDIEVRKSKSKAEFIRFERDFHERVKKKLVSR